MEVWKDIPGYELKYMVSDHGRVFSTCRRTWRFLKPWRSSKGYMNVLLDSKHPRTVHDLVLTSFVGPRPAGLISRHLNGIHNDNRLINLEWNTQSVNVMDVKHHGGTKRNLSVNEIVSIKQSLALGMSRKSIAKAHDISVSTVQHIDNGTIHKEIPDKLTIVL